VDKVLVIMEENRSVRDVTAHLPYLMSKAHQYGYATDYHAIRHPSLPNYLAIAGGSTFGVTDDEDPAVHRVAGHSVFGTLLAGGHTAKTYADGMTSPCARRNQGDYAVRHNPWTYFAEPSERTACRQLDVPAGSTTHGALAADVAAGRLPTFGLLVPDVCHDGHDCSATVTDRWLQSWLPVITSGPDFTTGRLAVVVTWDEDDDHSGNRIPLVVLHPSLTGRAVSTPLDHYALSGSILRLAGQQPLRKGAGTPDLLQAFGLR
jgi:acid phosphatase